MIYLLIVPGPIKDVDDVRILEWHVKEGGAVSPGALIVELETHKAIVEVRANQGGFMRRILCAEGGWRALGEALALLGDNLDDTLPQTLDGLSAIAVTFEII